ncbi:MAG: GNAT family N-acetyltransferase [Candidatus Hodarchaeota archaeon]
MEKIIRYASEEDFELLISMYLTEVENHNSHAEQFAKDLLYKLNTLLCITNDKVIGTVSWDRRGGLNDGVVELIGLGVNSSFRRQGIAKLLIISLIDEAKKFFSADGYKLRVIFFFMEKENNVGRLFYKNVGFREVSTIPEFYPDDDATIWIKYF